MLKVLYIHCKIKMNTTKKTNTLFDLNLRNLDIPVTDVTSIIIDQTQNLGPNLQFFWPNFGKKWESLIKIKKIAKLHLPVVWEFLRNLSKPVTDMKSSQIENLAQNLQFWGSI